MSVDEERQGIEILSPTERAVGVYLIQRRRAGVSVSTLRNDGKRSVLMKKLKKSR